MTELPRSERDKLLVGLRNSDPKTYSFRKLGAMFNITGVRASQIYWRAEEKESRKSSMGASVNSIGSKVAASSTFSPFDTSGRPRYA